MIKPLSGLVALAAFLPGCRTASSLDGEPQVSYSRQEPLAALVGKPRPAKLILPQTRTKPFETLTGTVTFHEAKGAIAYEFCRGDQPCVTGESTYSESSFQDFVTPQEEEGVGGATCYSLDRLKEVVRLQATIRHQASNFALTAPQGGESVLCWLAKDDKYGSWIMNVNLTALPSPAPAAPKHCW